MNEVNIRKATTADYNTVVELLQSASLPIEGIAEHFQHFLVAENGDRIVSAIGLEVYGGWHSAAHPSHDYR